MNCFYHGDHAAVGLCKSCARGICHDCAADIEDGLACRGRCEERARTVNRIIDFNSRVLGSANTQLRRNMLFSVIAGLLFVAFGVHMGFDRSGLPGGIFVLLGVTFVIRGIGSYTRSARYPTPEKEQ